MATRSDRIPLLNGGLDVSIGDILDLADTEATADTAAAITAAVADLSLVSGLADIVTGGTARTKMATVDFTNTPGAITALTGTAVTQTITGLLTTDQIHVELISAPPSGYLPPNARVSAADTLEMYFNTGVALGITLGALNFRATVIR